MAEDDLHLHCSLDALFLGKLFIVIDSLVFTSTALGIRLRRRNTASADV